MAEVRKKKVEDTYNTAKIKKAEKVTKKVTDKKVVEKKSSSPKNEVKEEQKKGLWTKFRIFCHGVKSEFLKVHWPSKENMIKYSIATIFFIIFCAGFFYLIDVIFAFVQTLFN